MAIEHKVDREYVTFPLPCEADSEKDHWFMYIFYSADCQQIKTSVYVEKKGANHVNLDFMMLKLFKKFLQFESNFRQS